MSERLMSALDQKQTFAVQKIMSALAPIADMCRAQADVRFVPIADIATSLNHLVGELQERVTNRQAERLGRFKIDDKFVLVR